MPTETRPSATEETQSNPRPELLIIGIPLAILVFTTAVIQVAAGNHKLYFPLILTPSIASDYSEVPRVAFALLVGIALCVVAYQRRSHNLAVFATLATTAMVFCETLIQWATPPGDALDLRITATIALAYAPQMIAAVALGVHALIEVAPVEPEAPEVTTSSSGG